MVIQSMEEVMPDTRAIALCVLHKAPHVHVVVVGLSKKTWAHILDNTAEYEGYRLCVVDKVEGGDVQVVQGQEEGGVAFRREALSTLVSS